MRAAVVVLAHAGGWDEALFVAVPIVVLIGLLRLASKRAASEERQRDASVHQPDR